MTNCYNCGAELTNKPKKEWNYTTYHVKIFICAKCNKSTMRVPCLKPESMIRELH